MSAHKKDNRVLPVRLIDTKAGLVFEWGLRYRAKVKEMAPAVADYEFASCLLKDLLQSDWVPPPSLKKPAFYPEKVRSLESVTVRLIQQAWTQAVARRYGSVVLKLGLKILPRTLDLFHLSQIKGSSHVLLERLQEHSNLGPLLSIDPSMWSQLSDWKTVKNRLIAMGMVNRTWRWLCKRKPAYIAQIDWTQLSHIAWVNFHASVALPELVHYVDRQTAAFQGLGALTTWVRANHDQLFLSHCISVLRVVKLSIKHLEQAETEQLKKEIILEELPLVADWARARVGISKPNREIVNRNWTYNTLINKQAHWHLADLVWAEPNQNIFWPEHLGSGEIAHDTQFTELSSLNALLQESKKMHHCVPSYIERCVSGEVVLFHLARRGKQLERATLEISRSGASGWAISQLKGPCNVSVSTTMWSHANVLLQRMLVR